MKVSTSDGTAVQFRNSDPGALGSSIDLLQSRAAVGLPERWNSMRPRFGTMLGRGSQHSDACDAIHCHSLQCTSDRSEGNTDENRIVCRKLE